MLFYFLRRLLSSLYPFIIVVSSCCYFFTQTAYSHFSPVPSQPALFSTPSRCREAVVDSRYWNKGRAGGRQKVGRSRSRRFHFPTEVGPRKWSDEWSEASEQCGHFPSHVAVAGQGRGPLRASVCLSVCLVSGVVCVCRRLLVDWLHHHGLKYCFCMTILSL